MKNTHIPLKTPLLTGIHDARDSRAFPSTSASWRRLSFLGCLALALFVAQPAKAALVTFDDVVNGSTNEIRTSATSAGFDFTSIHFHVIDSPTSCTFGGCVANGTQYAAEDAPTLAGPVTMTPSGGGTFSLVSFDGAELFLDDLAAAGGGFPNAPLIHVVGNLSGGGTIFADFRLDGLKDGAGGVADSGVAPLSSIHGAGSAGN